MTKSSSDPVYEAPRTSDVWHVVAWLPAAQWSTSFALWAVLTVGWVLPSLDYPLRAVAPLGLAAAICRTLVLVRRSRSRSVPSWLAGCSLAADAALLTGLLDITGGPFNPFIVLYVVYVWLAVVALSPAWAALVAAVAAAGFGWLIVDHLRAGLLEHHRLNDLPTHLFTMGFTGTAVAELVAHYVALAQDALAQRQHLLEEARDQAARSDRLAALTTLAAGAAHELSTPLGTIAVASRELERSAAHLTEASVAVDAIQDDARLIRTEVDRCQVILDGMSGRASDGLPLVPVALSAGALVQLAQNRLVEDRRRRLRVAVTSGGWRNTVNPTTLYSNKPQGALQSGSGKSLIIRTLPETP